MKTIKIKKDYVMNSQQQHKVSQIKGFVNLTLKQLKYLHNSEGVTETEAMLLIQAVLYKETDKEVIKECEAFFKQHYNY